MRSLMSAVVVVVLAGSLACAAQDKGYWRAASNSAVSITGDITIANAKVTINFSTFPLAPIRTLSTAEVAAAFDADVNVGGNGNLYRLNVPAAKRFLHHNTLCGTEDTQWMATYVEGKTMQVAFFSGANAPVLTMDALANSTDLCGTYTYGR
ncbi:MAG: hypothetical protein WCA37_17065 [Terracidiphilus sp.]